MSELRNIPEIAGLDSRSQMVRIAPDVDVPLTDRVKVLVDAPEFRRLAGVSQLGLVRWIYPSANHSRFEHSLGVYRLALLFLRRLSHDERFVERIQVPDAERFLVAALLHDLGHWPFCHLLEDIQLEETPRHEDFARRFLESGEIGALLKEHWGMDPASAADLLSGNCRDDASRVLDSLLSGPIDIDKMDYLVRDSLHAGVPYGRHFDQERLIGSLCLNQAGDGLAITEKGKTAAELMVIARYVMFSEVYWHHGVRAATAMLQRAFFLLRDQVDWESLFLMTDQPFIEELIRVAENTPAAPLLHGLFGPVRRLYKRVAQYSHFEDQELYDRLSGKKYASLTECARRLAEEVTSMIGEPVAAEEILIDAPPRAREVQFNVDVFFPKTGTYRRLDDVSPVVRALVQEQFDDYVKKVRVFVAPRLAEPLRNQADLTDRIRQATEKLS
ncbi:MAG: HD domain-containing protein [Planctomycetales bacterium]